MTIKTIVVVSGLDDSGQGEISILDAADNAARFIETLLESGVATERIRVFHGEEMEMRVTHRPVVSFNAGEAQKENTPQVERDEALEEESVAVEDEEPAVVEARDRRVEEVVSAMAASGVARVDNTPYTRDGIRFSSLFRPA